MIEHQLAKAHYQRTIVELRECERDLRCAERDMHDAADELRKRCAEHRECQTALNIAKVSVKHAGRAMMRVVTAEATRRVLEKDHEQQP